MIVALKVQMPRTQHIASHVCFVFTEWGMGFVTFCIFQRLVNINSIFCKATLSCMTGNCVNSNQTTEKCLANKNIRLL